MHEKCGNCGFKNNEIDSIFSCKCEDMGRRLITCSWTSYIEFEWVWDPRGTTSESCLFEDEKTIVFHPKASNGTAVVRGTELLTSGIHYWEIKATTHLYGTDVVIARISQYFSDDRCGWKGSKPRKFTIQIHQFFRCRLSFLWPFVFGGHSLYGKVQLQSSETIRDG